MQHFGLISYGGMFSLPGGKGISLIPATAVSVQVTWDASGSWGCGAFWDVHWYQLPWPEGWMDIPITAKELAPIVLAAMLWGYLWHGQWVQFVCNNMVIVACITSGSSRDQLVMYLIRSLWLISAHYQFDVCAIHIPGQKNVAADALSNKRTNVHVWTYVTIISGNWGKSNTWFYWKSPSWPYIVSMDVLGSYHLFPHCYWHNLLFIHVHVHWFFYFTQSFK